MCAMVLVPNLLNTAIELLPDYLCDRVGSEGAMTTT
jgi:diacylglycerol kinase